MDYARSHSSPRSLAAVSYGSATHPGLPVYQAAGGYPSAGMVTNPAAAAANFLNSPTGRIYNILY